MAYSQADIDALKASIATGAFKVRYADGREVTYRSLTDMQRTLAVMQTDSATSPATFQSNRIAAGYRSNLS